VTITGHDDKFYDGNYVYVSHWNCQPHFVSNEGAHLYFYVGIDSAKWALDDRDQSGEHAGQYDYHRGGWIESITSSLELADFMWDLNMNAWVYGLGTAEQDGLYINLKLKSDEDGSTHVRVTGHPEERYRGDYYRDGFWNAKPHFVNSAGSHLYYYNSIGHASLGYWQFDDRDQWENFYPGNSDWYAGGWFTSPTGDFYYAEDLDGGAELYYAGDQTTIQLELNEGGSGGGWWPWGGDDEETVDPTDETSVIYDYEFDPDSIYRSDGVPVLNGQPVYTLNQLYD